MNAPPGADQNRREVQELYQRFAALSAEISVCLDAVLIEIQHAPVSGNQTAFRIARDLVAAQYAVTQQLALLSGLVDRQAALAPSAHAAYSQPLLPAPAHPFHGLPQVPLPAGSSEPFDAQSLHRLSDALAARPYAGTSGARLPQQGSDYDYSQLLRPQPHPGPHYPPGPAPQDAVWSEVSPAAWGDETPSQLSPQSHSHGAETVHPAPPAPRRARGDGAPWMRGHSKAARHAPKMMAGLFLALVLGLAVMLNAGRRPAEIAAAPEPGKPAGRLIPTAQTAPPAPQTQGMAPADDAPQPVDTAELGAAPPRPEVVPEPAPELAAVPAAPPPAADPPAKAGADAAHEVASEPAAEAAEAPRKAPAVKPPPKAAETQAEIKAPKPAAVAPFKTAVVKPAEPKPSQTKPSQAKPPEPKTFAPVLLQLKDGNQLLTLFKDLQKRHPGALGGKTPELRPSAGPGGASWMSLLAVPPVTREEAERVCRDMGAEGSALGCKVSGY